MESGPLKALAELVGRCTGEYSGDARHDVLHAIFSNGLQASRYSSQFGQHGGCRSEAHARARRTACSFGSSTEIVSSASLHSRRSTSGNTAVVQGRWTSSARKAARLSSCAMDRSMRAGGSCDMIRGGWAERSCEFIQHRRRWQAWTMRRRVMT